MAEDTARKFYSIMDKLFQTPKSNLSLPPSSSSSGGPRKRPYSSLEPISIGHWGGGIADVAEPGPCRPWDRGDLFKRLATFKAMKWFAKPKVMDAVNCARRGWTNVDVDIIACDVCGARLQFSIPSTYSREQTEKAAQVFSLKLDNGHKLLCPWIDNACDEKLALFPPMPAPMLVDQYKRRSSLLLQLSALPVISASTVESMRNPQLEHFLKQAIAVECGSGPDGSSWNEYIGNDVETVSSSLHYQAHRLLSLFGWEPRSLPYVVDCSDHMQSDKIKDSFGDTTNGEKNNMLTVYVSCTESRVNEDLVASGVRYDPRSTVLDCKLCGASIGLWSFATVPRPLELIRVVGYADNHGEVGNGSQAKDVDSDCGNKNGEATTSRGNKLNLSIGGGPPPTKQNFRAKISLPVIGRNVRARFTYESLLLNSPSEEEHTSPFAITEGPTESVSSLEDGSGGGPQGDLSNGLGSQCEVPLSVTDDCISLQQHSTDTEARMDLSCGPSGSVEGNGTRDIITPTLLKDSSSLGTADLWRQPSGNRMEFDPIKQHRYFCPWVASVSSTNPGWQQTLSALQKQKVFLLPDDKNSPSSSSFIKVDDPIMSIRKLFESPPSKRVKPALT